jgi:hypothetical protein
MSIEYYPPWTLIPAMDTKEKTKIGLVDLHDGKSYIIQMMADVSKDSLTDASYYEYSKQLMLQPDKRNKLLFENDTIYHGHSFRQMVFLMFTEKWGLLKMVSLIRRTGKECCTVQISFPVSEKKANERDVPAQLRELDEHIRINEK